MSNIDSALLRQPGLFERTFFLVAEITAAVDQARAACLSLEAKRASQSSEGMATAIDTIGIAIGQAKKLSDSLAKTVEQHRQSMSVGAAE